MQISKMYFSGLYNVYIYIWTEQHYLFFNIVKCSHVFLRYLGHILEHFVPKSQKREIKIYVWCYFLDFLLRILVVFKFLAKNNLSLNSAPFFHIFHTVVFETSCRKYKMPLIFFLGIFSPWTISD